MIRNKFWIQEKIMLTSPNAMKYLFILANVKKSSLRVVLGTYARRCYEYPLFIKNTKSFHLFFRDSGNPFICSFGTMSILTNVTDELSVHFNKQQKTSRKKNPYYFSSNLNIYRSSEIRPSHSTR